MTSTEIDPQLTRALIDFYRRNILPLHAGSGHDALSRRAVDGPNTFFVTRQASRMIRTDFELQMADEAQIIRSLRARWKDTPLEKIPKPLLRLARQFERTQQQAQVSAFVYEMF